MANKYTPKTYAYDVYTTYAEAWCDIMNLHLKSKECFGIGISPNVMNEPVHGFKVTFKVAVERFGGLINYQSVVALLNSIPDSHVMVQELVVTRIIE